MTYIKFDKKELVNLEFSLQREIIRTNRAGTYASTTIVGCNTRKYHGLLVSPMPHIDQDNHVLLSSLDLSVTQNDATFNLGIRKYPFIYEPRGHKYMTEFNVNIIPEIIYQVGGVKLKMERVLCEDERILIKYTLLEAKSATKLTFKPFLAFRNVHKLSKANLYVNKKYTSVENGIKIKMYEAYKPLFLQFSKKVEYVHVPDWYYNVEYEEELRRGYDYQEDLFVPGYFEADIKKGESIVFSAGLTEIMPRSLVTRHSKAIEKRLQRQSYLECLKTAADQFIVKQEGKTEVIAGFPWFGRWGRDTFIAVPGLTLTKGDAKTCEDVLKTMTKDLKDGLFPNIGYGPYSALNSVDAPLWFFWALQELAKYKNDLESVWKTFNSKMKNILDNFRKGTVFNIKMHDNGLIYAGEQGKALTWMDAVVNGQPVTPRSGYAVEINALWYNAVMFALECAQKFGDKEFVKRWKDIPELTKKSFIDTFWSEEKRYLADFTENSYTDWSVRPNQIFACSLPYSPLNDVQKERVLETVRKTLLTPKGLRSLNPDNPAYKGFCVGSQEERDSAYHQGTVWPWLLGHFCEGYLKIHGKSAYAFINKILDGFKDDMTKHGLCTVSEIYDGDPPHTPRGAISQAWSVSELLRINQLLEKYKSGKEKKS
jgi:predicted glycogen debranching enzyme